MGNYKTVYQSAQVEIIIEKSRFIGYVLPIQKEEDAINFIATIKKKHWDATHNVPVYVLGDQFSVQRYSDDGEPSGTAGVPILEMLKKEEITNVCVVVTRYFGGVKLGTGGLVRAYTQAAKDALEMAILVEKKLFFCYRIKVSYTSHGKLQNYFQNDDTVITGQTLFTDLVDMQVYFEPEHEKHILEQITEMTSGHVETHKEEDVFLTLKDHKLFERW